MTPQTIAFASSPFWPVAIGFFGLGTGYFSPRFPRLILV